MAPHDKRLSRRNFLLTAGAGGAAAAASLLPKGPAPAPAAAGKRASQSYAEGEHIRKYYRTAKI